MPGAKPGAVPRKPSGEVPAWALKLGTIFTTISIFAGSFGYATTHLYATNAPLQPATVAAADTSAGTTTASTSTATSTSSSRPTTTLTSSVRTTTQTAVTTTRHS